MYSLTHSSVYQFFPTGATKSIVHPWLNELFFISVLTGIGLSYNDRYEVNLIATSEIAKDQETMDTIVNTYFADEVETLLQQIEK